jgi:regulation of enolase protein 1 (concanavalin A-like superfamily)
LLNPNAYNEYRTEQSERAKLYFTNMTQDKRDWQLLRVSESVEFIWENVTRKEAATRIQQMLYEFRADPERVAAAEDALREREIQCVEEKDK